MEDEREIDVKNLKIQQNYRTLLCEIFFFGPFFGSLDLENFREFFGCVFFLCLSNSEWVHCPINWQKC